MKFMIKRTSAGDDKCPCDESHREEFVYSDGIQTTRWFIEINTLEELIEFSKTYGLLVVGLAWEDWSIPFVEIYDDYREQSTPRRIVSY